MHGSSERATDEHATARYSTRSRDPLRDSEELRSSSEAAGPRRFPSDVAARAAAAPDPAKASDGVTEESSKQVGGAVARALATESPRHQRVFPLFERAVYVAVAAALTWGWHSRPEQYISADEGLGYALGIAGGACMLALFLYPLRKRSRNRRLGSIKAWFRAHIVLGVVGPALILFHSNFGTGSLNDNVALFSMLLVAASGLFGRFVYAHIQSTLRDRRATLEELRKDLGEIRSRGAAVESVARLDERLRRAEEAVLTPPASVLESAVRPLRLALKTRWDYYTLKSFARRQLREDARLSQLHAKNRRRLLRIAVTHIRERLRAVRRVAEFGFYERVFSRWHMFHYPLFVVLLVAAILHVVAVHLY
jgi:hypothetical protein